MQPFSTTCHISQGQFRTALLKKLYSKPPVVIFSIAGLLCVIIALLGLFGAAVPYQGNNIATLVVGFVIIAYVPMQLIRGMRKFMRSGAANTSITYTFREKNIVVQGAGTAKEIPWNKIITIQDAGSLLILGDADKQVFYLDQSSLLPDQRQFVLSSLTSGQMARLFRKAV